MDVTKVLDTAIHDLETRLAALKAARNAIVTEVSSQAIGRQARPSQRRFTAAQRAEISRRMKATWAARRSAKEA
jgi:hypothetical protein